jgi:peptidase A4-like protein
MRKRVVFIAAVAAASVAAGAFGGFVGHSARDAAPAGHTAGHRPSAAFLARARTALTAYLNHGRATMLTQPAGSAANGSSRGSYNWAGYVDVGAKGTFTHAAGSWVVPTVTCGAEDQLMANWIGLDGFNSNTVEQAGTTGWCYRGVATYFTWYEMYPAPAVEVGTSLHPGDVIRTSIARSGSNYTLVVTDSTHPAAGFTHKATCATTKCFDTSAEWIIERPAFQIGVAPLANYGTWSLTGAVETALGKAGTIGSYTASGSPIKLTMGDATQAYNLTSVTSLTGGNAFTTTWHNSY